MTAQLLAKCGCRVVPHKKTGNNTSSTSDDTGDVVCEPVDKATATKWGTDCKLDGFNVSIEALKNIVTDKPTPITKPLTSDVQLTKKK